MSSGPKPANRTMSVARSMDPHRRAHVQLQCPCERTGLDASDWLPDRHEVPRHLLIGDRYRTPCSDLRLQAPTDLDFLVRSRVQRRGTHLILVCVVASANDQLSE